MDLKSNFILALATALPFASPSWANSGAPASEHIAEHAPEHTAQHTAEHGAKPVAEGMIDPSGGTSPRIEIRKYRFFRDARLQRERLVLEFERRDFYHENKPRVSFEALSTQEILVKVENAVLMGAVPESLINDSYAHQSKYLGPIAMDDRALGTGGLSMKVKLKDYDLGYHAEWLSSPARLVVDVFPKNGPAAKQLIAGNNTHSRAPKSLDIERKSHIPGTEDFICFPAKSKVDLAVVFQPSQKQIEDVQKFRVHIDGSSIGLNTAVDQESIVCYPRTAQVKATLSFQISQSTPASNGAHGGGGLFNFAHPMPAPAGAPTAQAPLHGSEMDLDPGALTPGGGAGAHGNGAGNPNAGGAHGPAMPSSLLPPLGGH